MAPTPVVASNKPLGLIHHSHTYPRLDGSWALQVPAARPRASVVMFSFHGGDQWLQQAAQEQAQKLAKQFEQLQQNQVPAMLEAAATQHQRLMQELGVSDPARGMRVSQQRMEEIARAAARRVEQVSSTRGLDPAVLSLSRGLGRIGETVDDISNRIATQYASNPELFKSLYEEFLQEQATAAQEQAPDDGPRPASSTASNRPPDSGRATARPSPGFSDSTTGAAPASVKPASGSSSAAPPVTGLNSRQDGPGRQRAMPARPAPPTAGVAPRQSSPSLGQQAPPLFARPSPPPPASFPRTSPAPPAATAVQPSSMRAPGAADAGSPVRQQPPVQWPQQQVGSPAGPQRYQAPPPGSRPTSPAPRAAPAFSAPQAPWQPVTRQAQAQSPGMPPGGPVQQQFKPGPRPFPPGAAPVMPPTPTYQTASPAAGGWVGAGQQNAPWGGEGTANQQQAPPAGQPEVAQVPQGTSDKLAGWEDADARVVGWTVAVDKQTGRLPVRRRNWWSR